MNRSYLAAALAGAALIIVVLVLVLGGDDGKTPSPSPSGTADTPSPAKPEPGGKPNTNTPVAPSEAPADSPTWEEVRAAQIAKRGPDRPAELGPNECREDVHCSKAGGLLRCDTSAGQCKEPSLCVSDKDCIGDRLCFRGRCVAEIDGCRAQDCFPGICDHGHGECEQFPCKNDGDCAGTRKCNVENAGNCEDCQENAHCGEGKTCVQGICRKKGYCIGDGLCEPGSVCDQVSGDCVVSKCKPDPNEPNNKPENATPLAPEAPMRGELCMDVDESDFYRLDVSRGEGLIVSVQSDRDHGFMELRLYDKDKKDISRSGDWERQGYMELVVPEAAADGPYYLRVKFNQGIPTPYTIEWTPVPDGFCHDDPHEPNERLEDATELTDTRTWDMKLCGQDEDWFSHEIKPGQEVEVIVEEREGKQIPIVELYDDRSLQRIAKDDSEAPEKSLVFKGDHTGNFFVRVWQEDADADTDYAIRFVPK